MRTWDSDAPAPAPVSEHHFLATFAALQPHTARSICFMLRKIEDWCGKKLFESVKQLEQVYFLNLNSIDKKLYYSIAAMDVSRKLWQYFAQPQHKVCWWRRGGRSGAGQLGARPGSVIVTSITAAISTISTQNIYNIYTEYLQYLHRISSISIQFICTLLILFVP